MNSATPRNPAAGSFFAFLYDPPKPNDRETTSRTGTTTGTPENGTATPATPNAIPKNRKP